MESRFFFLIDMAQRQIFNFTDAECQKTIEVSVTQAAALMFISKNDGCSQNALSMSLNIKKSSITGLISRMKKNDLIVRKPNPDDARSFCLFLSDKGKAKLPAILTLVTQLNNKITHDFSEDDLTVIARFLNTIETNFSSTN